MVQRIQLVITTEERYRQAIDRELAEFERREREYMARERQERADRLDLVHFGLRKETAN
jgi:hypothetical protein